MSATPPARPAMRPKKAPASVFMKKKQPPRKPQPTHGANGPARAPNGAPPGNATQANGASTAQAPVEDENEWEIYPIYVSKKTMMQNLHYHAMKLQGKLDRNDQRIAPNPYSQVEFTRPVTLHRRQARDKLAQAELSDAVSGVDDKDRELNAIKREERQREREANQAQIAPSGGDTKRNARQKPKKKVEDQYFQGHNEAKVKQSKLKYEEARPWHLEDFEHKNVWVGKYEEPPSEESVMFEIGAEGFRMVPVEKWYRFTQTNRVNALDGEAVEKEMAKKPKIARWLLNTNVSEEEKRKLAMEQRRAAVKAQQRGGDDDDRPVKREDDYNADVDEVDYEWDDEFQDDDEGALFGDQDADEQKDIDKKMREEMRNAGLGATGIKDADKDYDAEEERQRAEEKAEKKMTKRLRKALMKKERKNEYGSDSEHGEFSESSESEDSEEERERLEQERKQEEERKANGEKSGTSTKGTNTPSGRTEKKDSARSGNSLKRPGSPDLSEMSGNESSRKRTKMNGASGSNAGRALSPDLSRAMKPLSRHTGASGSGSETESTAREGRPEIKIRNSPPTSPNGSRKGTPAGSRAQSPHVKRLPFPTLEEVRAAIPEEGIVITELVNLFRSRVQGRQGEFIPLVKSAGRQDPTSKKILPKTRAEMEAQTGKA